MDGTRFDALARKVSAAGTRRALLRSAVGGAAAMIVGGAATGAAAQVSTAACLGIGTRCGRKKQPGCGQCCISYASRQNSGQRRCACRPDFTRCDRNDECCGGVCCKVNGRRVCVSGIFVGSCDCDCSAP